PRPDMTPHRPSFTRRAFLARLVALGAGAPAVLAACGGGNDPGAPPAVDAATCRGYDPETASLRRTLGYTDASPVSGQYCNNCRFYTPPASAGDRCGGCPLIPGVGGGAPGPVAPDGYCRSWAPVAT